MRIKHYPLQNHWATGVEIGFQAQPLFNKTKIGERLIFYKGIYITLKLIGHAFELMIGKEYS